MAPYEYMPVPATAQQQQSLPQRHLSSAQSSFSGPSGSSRGSFSEYDNHASSSSSFSQTPPQSPLPNVKEAETLQPAIEMRFPRRRIFSHLSAASTSSGSSGSLFGTSSAAALIVTYFVLNLTLTFYNKSLLNNFPYPYFVTSLHAASGVIGCACLRLVGVQFGKQTAKMTQSSTAAYVPLATQDADQATELQHSQPQVHVAITEKVFVASPTCSPKHVPRQVDAVQTNNTLCDRNAKQAKSIGSMIVVLLYSTLYAANIAMSNASLSLVSVPFHQIVRSTCPLFTLLLSYFLLAKSPASSSSVMALVPIVAGAALSCIGGTIRYTSLGVILTVLGTFLAALKTVTTNVLQGGGSRSVNAASTTMFDELNHAPVVKPSMRDRLLQTIERYAFHYSALELLEVMSPLAFAQCFLASYWSGEFNEAIKHLYVEDALNKGKIALLAGNGAIAFLLNIVSFKTNRAAGPLTMTVVGNVKQVVTILLALHLYQLTLAPLNAVGICVALLGTAWYGMEEIRAKQKRTSVTAM